LRLYRIAAKALSQRERASIAMPLGLYRESEGQKSGKDRALEPLASRFLRFSFSILSLSVDAFLLGNLRVSNISFKPHSCDF
jgi:hypothetical protein